MKVFISWSGQRSKYVAESLRNWLPKVIQAVDPWMSTEDIFAGVRWGKDIFAGVRWGKDIFEELEATKFGIICITPENKINPWVNFEAGALSKTLQHTFVCPYLYDMNPSQLSGPLVQFQATKSDRDGTKKLVTAINEALGNKGLKPLELEEVFDVWWNKLENALNNTPTTLEHVKERSINEILDEILDNTREQLRKEDIRLRSIKKDEDTLMQTIQDLSLHIEELNVFVSQIKKVRNADDLKQLIDPQFFAKKLPDFSEIMNTLTQNIVSSRDETIELLGEIQDDED